MEREEGGRRWGEIRTHGKDKNNVPTYKIGLHANICYHASLSRYHGEIAPRKLSWGSFER
jgi:hypothetical protein